jgi:hypothetical protein
VLCYPGAIPVADLVQKLTLGDWCIGRRTSGTQHHQMYHCHRAHGGKAQGDHHHIVLFTGRSYKSDIDSRPRRVTPRWCCVDCEEIPPDELVGAYILLEMDYATERIEAGVNNT